jgi:hypothetical protein
MECESCECLRNLAKSAAEALRNEASVARTYAATAQKSGGSPDPSVIRPSFDGEIYQASINRLVETGFVQFGQVDKSRLIQGRYNSIQFAERLQKELADGLHQQDEAATAITAAESLEEAADALEDIAAFGFMDCVLREP